MTDARQLPDCKAAGGPLGRVLVTGATGFLGQRVLLALVGRPGVTGLVAASRRRSFATGLPLGSGDVHELDLTGVVRVPAGVRTVIHVAGEKRDPSRMPAVNEEGARRLANAACEAGVSRFVHVSSVGVYGAPPDAGVVDESRAHNPVGAYEASKSAGERAVRQVCRNAGLDCVVLRPSNVIGLVPGGGFPLRGLVRSIGRGLFAWFGPVEYPWLNYVQVDDAAAAIVAAAELARAGGQYHVNCPVRLADAVTWIAEELGVPCPSLRLPRWTGRLLGVAGSAASEFTGRGMPFDLARFRELTSATVFDASRLIRETGFTYPLGAEATLRGLARAYRKDVAA